MPRGKATAPRSTRSSARVYDEVRPCRSRCAASGEQTLSTTAVVHEAYLKLAGGAPVEWEDRACTSSRWPPAPAWCS
ncbi:MAG: hypothetical protein U0527_00555 [Candidatus Eisenbacteria bacterium]